MTRIAKEKRMTMKKIARKKRKRRTKKRPTATSRLRMKIGIADSALLWRRAASIPIAAAP